MNENTIIESMFLEALFKEFLNSKQYIDTLLGLKIERSLYKFLILNNYRENVDLFISFLIPLFNRHIENEKNKVIVNNNLYICSHITSECSYENCNIVIKRYVFCPKKSEENVHLPLK